MCGRTGNLRVGILRDGRVEEEDSWPRLETSTWHSWPGDFTQKGWAPLTHRGLDAIDARLDVSVALLDQHGARGYLMGAILYQARVLFFDVVKMEARLRCEGNLVCEVFSIPSGAQMSFAYSSHPHLPRLLHLADTTLRHPRDGLISSCIGASCGLGRQPSAVFVHFFSYIAYSILRPKYHLPRPCTGHPAPRLNAKKLESHMNEVEPASADVPGSGGVVHW